MMVCGQIRISGKNLISAFERLRTSIVINSFFFNCATYVAIPMILQYMFTAKTTINLIIWKHTYIQPSNSGHSDFMIKYLFQYHNFKQVCNPSRFTSSNIFKFIMLMKGL